ncbi:thiamine transporter 1-like isoform X2 [Octopus sinensis]|uniref:Thiamine transporter 1-like isoform X2 n=1 Tax=Octopus sinensis TaxID=2607531 RepID=A0A6P7SR92_9MOLL|nr:thiamine transporter 1-like isoform X2 [Octopus sinensis]
MKWKIATAVICCFGVFKGLRPSESYLTSYLTSADMKNLSVADVNSQVYPVWTYSYLATLFLVLLITDYLRYKIVIIFEAIAYIITWFLLLWGKSILHMQLMQVVYGFATSTEIAYYSYIYAAVSEDHYRKVSGFVRGSNLIGRFFAAIVGQILVISGVNYFKLNIISTVNVCIAFVISIFLPKVEKSFYFHKQTTNQSTEDIDLDSANYQNTINSSSITQLDTDSSIHSTKDDNRNNDNIVKVSFKDGIKKMARDFIRSYSHHELLIWSFWWAMDSCGNLQLGNYIQNLWIEITPNRTHTQNYNGAVDAASMALSAASSFGVGFLKIEWNSYENVLLFSVNVIISSLMIVMALATKIWLAYMCYIIIRISYHTVLTIATYQIATFLDTQSYALVFGFNTFLALVLETILTIIVVDKRGLNLDIRTQFIVYGGYFGVLALPFLARMLYCFFVKRRSMAFKNENT